MVISSAGILVEIDGNWTVVTPTYEVKLTPRQEEDDVQPDIVIGDDNA